jgi:hypothetical protein
LGALDNLWANLQRRKARSIAAPPSAGAIAERLADEPIGRWRVGWRAIERRLSAWLNAREPADRRRIILFGTYHDSAGQVSAFRRLIGPLGLRGLTHVAVEQFDADGHWRSTPPALARGDSSSISSYLRHGTRASIATLFARQHAGNYTGWKYDHLHELIDVVAMSRAQAITVLPCDMPRACQRWSTLTGNALVRLREAHCALALRDRLPKDVYRMLMLWGQDHLAPAAFPRLIEPEVPILAIYVFGQRPAERAVETELARHYAIAEPVLLMSRSREPSWSPATLLLPDARLGVVIDRSRRRGTMAPSGSALGPRTSAAGKTTLILLTNAPGRIELARQGSAVPAKVLKLAKAKELTLDPGSYSYRLASGSTTLIGRIELTAGARVELEWNALRRELQLAHHE